MWPGQGTNRNHALGTTTAPVWRTAVAALMLLAGCQRSPNTPSKNTVSYDSREFWALNIEACIRDHHLYTSRDDIERAQALIHALRQSAGPVPPRLLVANCGRDAAHQKHDLELVFYDEEKIVRGFRVTEYDPTLDRTFTEDYELDPGGRQKGPRMDSIVVPFQPRPAE